MGSLGRGEVEELKVRVERLERQVEGIGAELRRALGGCGGVGEFEGGELSRSESSPGGVSRGLGEFSQVTASERGTGGGLHRWLGLERFPGLPSGEWWLNKVGIGLVLLGVAFLFIYGVERGWIGPWPRVGAGFAIGATLLVLGLRVRGGRRALAQVLTGGGVGALYTTGFAAFQVYSLLPHAFAFAFMVAVTMVAFSLSLREDGVALALIGALGGLGTPFLLYDGGGALGGLVLYTCIILVGMGAVYLRKGWVSLLAVSFVGGWMVFLVGYADAFFSIAGPSAGDRRALQAGVICAWLLFWVVPVAREGRPGAPAASTRAFVYSTPLVSLGFCALIWELPAAELGWVPLCGAAGYALAALAGQVAGWPAGGIPRAHALVALVLVTLAAALMVRGDALLLALAAEATALHYLSRRYSDRAVSAYAHTLFLAAGSWLAIGLLTGTPAGAEPGRLMVDAGAVVDLLVIGLLFGASLLATPLGAGPLYRAFAHAAVLAWLWRELSVLPGGEAYVTIAWGAYAVGLLMLGLRLDLKFLLRGGMATLILVVGKLFLVDLAEVGALWRVLLFLGFGALFLLLSYYGREFWRPAPGSSRDPGERNEKNEQP